MKNNTGPIPFTTKVVAIFRIPQNKAILCEFYHACFDKLSMTFGCYLGAEYRQSGRGVEWGEDTPLDPLLIEG